MACLGGKSENARVTAKNKRKQTTKTPRTLRYTSYSSYFLVLLVSWWFVLNSMLVVDSDVPVTGFQANDGTGRTKSCGDLFR